MPRWRNWSGRLEARPTEVRFLRSEADGVALVQQAAAGGSRMRVFGSGHSHAPLVPTDGIVVDVSGLSGVIDTDGGNRTARVRAGTPIHALGRPLHDAGLALRNQGDIDRQTIAGACATGTHGTGAGLTCLSDAVVGARLILASGEIVECGPDRDPALWQAARLNLGALGIVTELTLALRDAYRLAEHGWREPWDTLAPRLADLGRENRHFEFFWYPRDDEAVVKTIAETDEPARYPLGEEGGRLAWSYEVLPNHRPHPHTEMEYSVPAEHGAACFADLRAMIRRDFPEVRWPVEYRLVAADDVWLSMACGRATVTLSVHQDVREDETDYYRACEAVFLDYGGRPHWGKMHDLDGPALEAAHPHWREWWAVRDRVDPDGLFLNDYLQARRPG